MSKRDNGAKRTSGGPKTTADTTEQRVVEFADQLGRMAGTFQSKAEGWMDRATLNKQVASVRDGAADLLKYLAGASTRASKKPTAVGRGGAKGRSGGVVDARGKKHRKPMPPDPDANMADSQAAKVRTAMTMVKTTRHRGRG